MRRCIFSVLTCAVLSLLLIEVQLQTVVAQPAPEEVEDNESTCSLDPSTGSDCQTTTDEVSNADGGNTPPAHGQDLTRQVISLADETFDELTSTSTPATWLIMFKTNSCAICKKARPIFEELSFHTDVVDHNDKELEAISSGKTTYEELTEDDDGDIPKGPVYVATIDAGWSGRDTTKRFDVDATPTIILLRNEGYNNNNNKETLVDSRSYYVYRGQRATYPLRNFVLGGYALRKKTDMPPPLPETELKPKNHFGRGYDYFMSPSVKWAGNFMFKVLCAWFLFTGVLGLFMRIHNYAWGENADGDYEAYEKSIEAEKAQGRKEAQEESSGERSERQRKAMWKRKAQNRAKFAANKEAREKKKREEGLDDEFEGVGFSVKKTDVKKGLSDSESAAKSKSS